MTCWTCFSFCARQAKMAGNGMEVCSVGFTLLAVLPPCVDSSWPLPVGPGAHLLGAALRSSGGR